VVPGYMCAKSAYFQTKNIKKNFQTSFNSALKRIFLFVNTDAQL